MCKQSTPVGCVLPICPHRSALIATTDVAWGEGGCPQVNKFEQVSSDRHQMSLAVRSPDLMGGRSPGLMSLGETALTVRSYVGEREGPYSEV